MQDILSAPTLAEKTHSAEKWDQRIIGDAANVAVEVDTST